MKGAIPYPPPGDSEEIATIKTFVDYIIRNGDAFESKVKEKEAGNSKFSFLFLDQNPDGYRYYCWLLFCSRHNYTEEQTSLIELTFTHRIQQAPPGSIELTQEDHELLVSLMRQNNGTKDCIKGIRKWLVEYSHSLCSSIQTICDSLKLDSEAKFPHYLRVIYVFNDLLFNGSGASTRGPYTRILDSEPLQVPIFKILLPYLPWLLQRSFRLAENDEERERVTKMVTLWASRGFIDGFLSDQLTRLILQSDLVPYPPPALLASPYPQGLPPPNIPVPPTLPPGFRASAPVTVVPPNFPPPPPPFRAPMLAASPLPPMHPWLDLHNCSVGSMSNIARHALKSGHPRYTPLDINSISRVTPQTVEPGRLEARISEFYKKCESLPLQS